MERSTAIAIPAPARAGARAGAINAAAFVAWAGLIVVAWAWGTELNRGGAQIALNAPPLFGHWDLAVDPRILLAVGFAGAAVWFAPRLARSLSWRGVLAATALGALGWACALALAEGAAAIAEPLDGPSDYLATVPLVDSPGQFLATFTERIGEYSTHARSHPPGMVLVLWSLNAVGLGGAWPAASLILLVASSAPVAVLLATRALAGESFARAAAPFLALLPGAVWIATTADALFMGVSAWAAALGVLAACASGRRQLALAVGAGLLFGACAMLSYGLALVGLIPAAVAASARLARTQLIAALVSAAVILSMLAFGFWWVDGFLTIREQYLASIARERPYGFFLVSNLAAFAVAAGPAITIGLAHVRDRRLGLLVGAAVLALLLADLSGMSKAEVERIWLPFLPWIALAAAALPAALGFQRWMLAAQAALAISIQSGVAMIW
jgi:hypothetical protein